MNPILLCLLPILLFTANAGAAECEQGWTPYKDELCIKAFPSLLPYAEAKDFCFSQGNEISKASLVLIKDLELQEMLANYTHDTFNTLWLGGKYDEESSQFKWDDGEPFTYTNWQEGYPRNSSDTPCIELKPINAKQGVNTDGKWADVNCQKQIQVMCQKALSWTLQDAINEIIRTRKELEATKEVISSTVVPVGSIYIEYFNQSNPVVLWPAFSWEDISSTYAGMFFRASGSGSGGWGVTQTECSPGISQVKYSNGGDGFPTMVNISSSGWSGWVVSGMYKSDVSHDSRELHNFYTEACEVRPKNQAVRVWKRIS